MSGKCRSWKIGPLEIEYESAPAIGQRSLFIEWRPQLARDFSDVHNFSHRMRPESLRPFLESEGWDEGRIDRVLALYFSD